MWSQFSRTAGSAPGTTTWKDVDGSELISIAYRGTAGMSTAGIAQKGRGAAGKQGRNRIRTRCRPRATPASGSSGLHSSTDSSKSKRQGQQQCLLLISLCRRGWKEPGSSCSRASRARQQHSRPRGRSLLAASDHRPTYGWSTLNGTSISAGLRGPS